MRLSAMISWVFAGLILAGLLGALALILGLTFFPDEIILVLFINAGFALMSLPCAITMERGRVRLFMCLALPHP